ncbi:hypothetical protein ACXR0O_11375 [Verrucomicrobiota bacterium sgz303538]
MTAREQGELPGKEIDCVIYSAPLAVIDRRYSEAPFRKWPKSNSDSVEKTAWAPLFVCIFISRAVTLNGDEEKGEVI